MVTLDNYNPILGRPTCTAVPFELFGKVLQVIVIEVKASNNSYRFAFAAFNLTAEPDDPVLFHIDMMLGWSFLFAGAFRDRVLTLGADAPGFGRVYQSGIFHCLT